MYIDRTRELSKHFNELANKWELEFNKIIIALSLGSIPIITSGIFFKPEKFSNTEKLYVVFICILLLISAFFSLYKVYKAINFFRKWQEYYEKTEENYIKGEQPEIVIPSIEEKNYQINTIFQIILIIICLIYIIFFAMFSITTPS